VKHLPWIEPEIRLQAIDDLAIRSHFNLHSNGRAFAAPVKLIINGIKKTARFFFFQIRLLLRVTRNGAAESTS